jgi:hypothetical protein
VEVGIPGTGVYYTSSTGYHTGVRHDGAGGGPTPPFLLAIAAVLLVAVLTR